MCNTIIVATTICMHVLGFTQNPVLTFVVAKKDDLVLEVIFVLLQIKLNIKRVETCLHNATTHIQQLLVKLWLGRSPFSSI